MSKGHAEQPTLTIYHPVSGLTDGHLIGVSQLMIRRSGGLFTADDFKGFFRPADKLEAGVLRKGEIRRLYKHLGHVSTEEETRDLGKHVVQSLGEESKKAVEADLLPSALHPPTESKQKALVVAVSPKVIDSRQIAKNAVRTFFDLPEIPNSMWFDNDYAAGVHLAHTKGEAVHRNMIAYVQGLLMEEGSPLFTEPIFEGNGLPATLTIEPLAEPKFNF